MGPAPGFHRDTACLARRPDPALGDVVCSGLAVPIVCADCAEKVSDGRVARPPGNGDQGHVALQCRLDQRPRQRAIAEMHVLWDERDAAAGGHHRLDPIFALTAIDDLGLEALLPAALEDQRGFFTIGPQQEALAFEVDETYGFLPLEAVAHWEDHDDAFAIKPVVPQSAVGRAEARGQRNTEGPIKQQLLEPCRFPVYECELDSRMLNAKAGQERC